MDAMNPTHRTALLLLLQVIAIVGCESQDRRLAEYAQRATEQQARQNERMAQQAEGVARQGQEVASAAHHLVEQDAAARRDLIQAQDKLQQQNQAERAGLDRQREHVESERKAASEAAVRDPVIARAIITAGMIMAALLPLLVTVYVIRRLPEQCPADELLGDALLQGLFPGEPISLSREAPPRSLADSSAPRLSGLDGPPATDGNPPRP